MVGYRDRRSGTKLAIREKWNQEELSLAALPLLDNVLGALNVLALGEKASAQYFHLSNNIAAGATATILDLRPPPGMVGIWHYLRQAPQTSNTFTVVTTVDGRVIDNDAAAIGKWLLPVSTFRWFVNDFNVVATNTNPVQLYVFSIRGVLYWVDHGLAQDLKNCLTAGVDAAIERGFPDEWADQW